MYFLAVLIGSLIAVNSSFQENPNATVVIYLLSNGIHTDFVFPIRNSQKNWSISIDIAELTSDYAKAQWIAFGWGDRKFYQETPQWSDLTLANALYALFFPSPSAIHVTIYQSITQDELCVPIKITEEQYSKLVDYVDKSFQKTEEGKCVRTAIAGYYDCDGFYEAIGKFHLFYTCNTWTNAGLKQSGLRSALWTPFDKGILYHYRK